MPGFPARGMQQEEVGRVTIAPRSCPPPTREVGAPPLGVNGLRALLVRKRQKNTDKTCHPRSAQGFPLVLLLSRPSGVLSWQQCTSCFLIRPC